MKCFTAFNTVVLLLVAAAIAVSSSGCRSAAERDGFERTVYLPVLRVEPPDPVTGKLYRSDSFLRSFRVARLSDGVDSAAEPLLSESLFATGGKLDFKPLDPAAGELTAYAGGAGALLLAVELDSLVAQKDITLFAGSTGNLKVWLNGELLHSYGRGPRKLVFCEDEIPGISLVAGKNIVVVRSGAPSGGLPWQFRLSLADASGRPLRLL